MRIVKAPRHFRNRRRRVTGDVEVTRPKRDHAPLDEGTRRATGSVRSGDASADAK